MFRVTRLVVTVILVAGCGSGSAPPDGGVSRDTADALGGTVTTATATTATTQTATPTLPEFSPDRRTPEREKMVAQQIEGRGVRDKAVLLAMRRVPRHLFVPPDMQSMAYDDRPLPIGMGQTISQPYIVAYMTEQLGLKPDDRVLEVGTGSGYQAAVAAEIVREVCTVEIIPELGRPAAERLAAMGYTNILTRTSDGYNGWKEHAPYDAIIVTAAASHVPPPLLQQLRPGGRIVIPVGSTPWTQDLVLVRKAPDGRATTQILIGVAFVPLTRAVGGAD